MRSSGDQRPSEEEEQNRRATRDVHPRGSAGVDVEQERGAATRSGGEDANDEEQRRVTRSSGGEFPSSLP
ncbi:uncharacterized protein DS421_3g68070 [Arachis hypogaea]|nr:uncharacterized protein DS421_3g68070 [Arachis hypogaea]